MNINTLDPISYLNNNNGVIALICTIISVVLIILVVVLIVISVVVLKRTKQSTLKIDARITYENDATITTSKFKQELKITIFNNNWRDVIVSDFGFKYRGLYLTFAEEYLRTKVKNQQKIIVPARQYIVLKVEPERLENFIIEHNFEAKGIDPIYTVIIDNVGNFVTSKNVGLTKVMVKRQQSRISIAKNLLHDKSLEDYMKTHDNQIPLKEHVYNIFHSRKKKTQYLVRQANTFINSELYVNDGELYKINKGNDKKEKVEAEPYFDKFELSDEAIAQTYNSKDVKVTVLESSEDTSVLVQDTPSDEQLVEPTPDNLNIKGKKKTN